MSIRTDQVLGRLLAAAECAAGGTENLIVVFSADHGVAPVPEVMQARKMPGGRIDKKAYLAAINKGLAEKFGEGKWILATAEAGLYINHVYTGHALMEHTASFSQIDEYVARGFFRERSPDVIVITKPYYLFGASGTSHGLHTITIRMCHSCSTAPAYRPERTSNELVSQTSDLRLLLSSTSRRQADP